MVGLCANHFQLQDFDKSLMIYIIATDRKSMISFDRDEKDICWKLMLITQVIFTIYTTTCCHSYLKIIDGKLTPNLNDKRNYVLVHIRVLDQALSHGLVLQKVHRVIEIDQSPWMKPYIDLNTGRRASARNDFEKDFYKLMNNSTFEKTMENVRKCRDIRFATNWYELHKLESKTNWVRTTMFDDDFAAVELSKMRIVMNRPTYIGQAVIEICLKL